MCFRHFLLWILFGSLTVGLAAPARADRICDSYPEQVSAADLQRFRTTFKYAFPAADASRLSQVRFTNGTDPSLLGPELRDGTGPNPLIEIPPGLKRLQCKLLRLEFYYMANCCDRREDIGKIVQDCATRTNRLRQCVERLLDERIAREEAKVAHRADQLHPLVEAAFRYALGHEVVHVVLNGAAAEGRGVASQLDDETAADVLAQFALVSENFLPISSIAVLAMASVADRSIDWSREEHPPTACRARIADRVALTIGPKVSQAYAWLVRPETYLAQRALRPVETLKVFIPGDTRPCPEPSFPALDAVRRDFDRILGALDLMVAESPQPLPAETALRRLMALRLATGEGERLRTNLASLSILRGMRLDDNNGPAALRRSAAKVEGLLARFKAEAMTSEAYGRLLVNRAIARYFQHPRGSDLRAMNAALRRGLERAEQYFADSGFAKLYLGKVAFMEGRCADGRAAFRALASLNADNPGVADDVHPFLMAETPAACAAAAQRLEAATKVQLGWTD